VDLDSTSGVLATTRSTGFAFAISWLRAGNPASPQSVPASILLNFFMPAPHGSMAELSNPASTPNLIQTILAND
jgi:hypothetical protein